MIVKSTWGMQVVYDNSVPDPGGGGGAQGAAAWTPTGALLLDPKARVRPPLRVCPPPQTPPLDPALDILVGLPALAWPWPKPTPYIPQGRSIDIERP